MNRAVDALADAKCGCSSIWRRVGDQKIDRADIPQVECSDPLRLSNLKGMTHEKSPGPAAYIPHLDNERSQSGNLNQELSSLSRASSKSRATTRSCTFGLQTRKAASSQGVAYISAEHSRSVSTRG